MARRSTVRRVEEFVLPGSELVDIAPPELSRHGVSGGACGLLRGEPDEKRTSIRMRECSRMRDEGRA